LLIIVGNKVRRAKNAAATPTIWIGFASGVAEKKGVRGEINYYYLTSVPCPP